MSNWAPFLGLPLWAWLFVIPTAVVIICGIFRSQAKTILQPLWRVLDKVYFVGGIISALFLVTILLIIIVQMITRWSGIAFQGSTEFAGYAMAAASFFALAHALTRGAHIRVSILLNMNKFTAFWLDAVAMVIAAVTATYFARFAIKTNFVSKMIGDRTQGQDMVPEWVITFFGMFKASPANWPAMWSSTGGDWVYTPVWLPQLPMSIGTILLAIALWDHLSRLVVNGETEIKGEAVE
jgi:TRAP-type C4-dicarboxylate transport system permease small subunit